MFRKGESPLTFSQLKQREFETKKELRKEGVRHVDIFEIREDPQSHTAHMVTHVSEEDPVRALQMLNVSPFRQEEYTRLRMYARHHERVGRSVLGNRPFQLLGLAGILAGVALMHFFSVITLSWWMWIVLPLGLGLGYILFHLIPSLPIVVALILDTLVFSLPMFLAGEFVAGAVMAIIGFLILLPIVWATTQRETLWQRAIAHAVSNSILGFFIMLLPLAGLIAMGLRSCEGHHMTNPASFAEIQTNSEMVPAQDTQGDMNFTWLFWIGSFVVGLFLVRKILDELLWRSQLSPLFRHPQFQAWQNRFHQVEDRAGRSLDRERELHRIIQDELLALESAVRTYNSRIALRQWQNNP